MKYQPRYDDIEFALKVWAELPRLLDLPGEPGDVDEATVLSVLREAGRFATEVLAPLDIVGHREGCALQRDGTVRLPTGWKDAFRQFVDAGWNTVHFPAAVGGQGLPAPVSVAVAEMFQAANIAFSLALMPFAGVVSLLDRFGSIDQKRRYLAPLVAGRWTATLAMTEAQAGTDLGAIRTTARPLDAESGVLIRGEKCFITYGEHNMSENIVHFLLARDPAGVPGAKGLSLYLVPKRRVAADGSLGALNDVRCVSVEKKMGIHGSPTTTLDFGGDGGAWGERLGEACKGVEHMFVVLARARLNIGVFGLSSAERAFQVALAYANERVQGTGPDGRPCVIARHPDVRRMLLEMQSGVDGMRALAYYAAGLLERSHREPDPALRDRSRKRMDLLTPIVKGWITEHAVAVTSTGVQIAGGWGYMDEAAASRCFREARVHPIYEGTTGVQAIDLALRRVVKDEGLVAKELMAEMRKTCKATLSSAGLTDLDADVEDALQALEDATEAILAHAKRDPGLVQAVAVHYLTLWGTMLAAWLLVRAAATDGARASVARFFVLHELIKSRGLARVIRQGASAVLG